MSAFSLMIVCVFRLKDLTTQSHCMVFMKGNRNEPKCGFSRQLIEILSDTGYATFQ